MLAKPEFFPFKAPPEQGLDPSILEIPLLDTEFDTHGTSGEHALKESGAWREFIRILAEEGTAIDVNDADYFDRLAEEGREPSDDDPFYYYLMLGPGKFYRARDSQGGPILTGMTIVPNEAGGYTVDHAGSITSFATAASAYHRILTRKFFDEFCGVPPLSPTNNLTIPNALLKSEIALARATYDYGVVKDSNLVIPMPGVAPFARELSDEIKDRARTVIQEGEVTGVLPYEMDDGEDYLVNEEFYRQGQLVGTLTMRSIEVPSQFRNKRIYEAFSAFGEQLDFECPEQDQANAGINVRFLKTLAEHDAALAALILG